ncbi:MAG: aspartate aminotransferase family protein [Salibacteraceae bacterium]
MSEPKDIFYKNLAQTTPFPIGIEIEKAKGSWLYGTDGQKWLDMISGVAVSNIGHNHPKVVSAIKNQVDKHMHVMVYGEYIQKEQSELAQELNSVLPLNLQSYYFVNSGTEANEAALKLAKRVTGRTELISFHNSYHGSTHGSLSVTGNENKKFAFRPFLPGVKFINFNSIPDISEITVNTAAVIMEVIQGDAGVRIPSLEFLKAIRHKCTETGALLIFDEIQTGMGRTGKMFAFEHYGVVPDILTLAKGFGGGMPIGAMISSKEKMRTFTHNPMLGHITTFGGHPVNCAAALANLKVIKNEINWKEVERKGLLMEGLLQHSEVKEIRRKGLFFAIDMDGFDKVKTVFDYCLENGVITFWFLSTGYAFRLSPPLNISDEDIHHACSVIQKGFELCK